MTGGMIVSGASFAMGMAGTPIRDPHYPGWVCVQCCVMATAAPAMMVIAFFALLGAGCRR